MHRPASYQESSADNATGISRGKKCIELEEVRSGGPVRAPGAKEWDVVTRDGD